MQVFDFHHFLVTSLIMIHMHRNFGIMLAMFVLFSAGHLISAQFLLSEPSRGEVLLFRRRRFLAKGNEIGDEEKGTHGTQPARRRPQGNLPIQDSEETHPNAEVSDGGAFLCWNDVHYNIKDRRILQSAHGWLQPGTVTLLMVGYFQCEII